MNEEGFNDCLPYEKLVYNQAGLSSNQVAGC